MTHPKRARLLNEVRQGSGPVVYWMSRDQRAHDNWDMIFAKELAMEQKQPLIVVFCLVPQFLDATMRQYAFMLKGLHEVEQTLRDKNIPFYLLTGSPEEEIPGFIRKYEAGTLVADFDPLRIKRAWKEEVTERISVPFYEVDARNIVPCWEASLKQEYGAYTIRPRIHRALPEFLEEFQPLQAFPCPWKEKIEEIN